MGILVFIVIGLSLTPVVQDFVDDYKDGDNATDASDDITGAKATLADLIPLFWIIGIVMASIGMAVGGLKGK